MRINCSFAIDCFLISYRYNPDIYKLTNRVLQSINHNWNNMFNATFDTLEKSKMLSKYQLNIFGWNLSLWGKSWKLSVQ